MRKLVVVLMVLAVLFMALPAQAGERDEGAKLTVTVEEWKTTQSGKTKCAVQTLYNVFDQWLWKWTHCRYWEYDGVKVTNAPGFTRDFDRSTIGQYWVYDGVVDTSAWWSNCSGNHSHSCHTRYSMGKMRLVVGGYDVQTVYPWLRMKVGYYGQSYIAGGGL